MIINGNVEFWKNYQEQAWSTCLPSCKNWEYLATGLINETGEIAGKVKKEIRGDYADRHEAFVEDMKSEIGDSIWYLSGIFKFTGMCSVVRVFYSCARCCLFYEAKKIMRHALDFVEAVEENKRETYCLNSKIDNAMLEYLDSLTDIASSLEFTLEDAATYNLEKLAKRYQTNKIIGSGDYR